MECFNKIIQVASIKGKLFREKNFLRELNPSSNHHIFLAPISMLFVSCLIIANITAQKPIQILFLTLPGGALIFPFSYIFANILTEVYGYKWARLLIWISIACNTLVFSYFLLTIYLPSANFWHQQSAYQSILGFVPRLVIASSASYLIGEHVNSYTLSKLKITTNGKYLWFRVLMSTAIGSIADSLVFIPLVFFHSATLYDMVLLGLSLTLFKVGYELIALPLTYYVVFFLKAAEDIDVYDKKTKFTPFSLDLYYSAEERRGYSNVIAFNDKLKN